MRSAAGPLNSPQLLDAIRSNLIIGQKFWSMFLSRKYFLEMASGVMFSQRKQSEYKSKNLCKNIISLRLARTTFQPPIKRRRMDGAQKWKLKNFIYNDKNGSPVVRLKR